MCRGEPFVDRSGDVHVPHYIATRGPEGEEGAPDAPQAKDAYRICCDARGWTLPGWVEPHPCEQAAWAMLARELEASIEPAG